MIKPEYIELMNQELDGTNSAKQSRDLEKYLSSREDARTYYRELAEAVDVFAKVEMLSPPPGLGNSILAQVDQRAGGLPERAISPGHRSLWESLRDLLRPRLEPAYAFTFAAGLVLGLALFAGSDWLKSGRKPGSGRLRERDGQSPGPGPRELGARSPELSRAFRSLPCQP